MENQQNLKTMRHSAAHLLAAAVKELYPGAKLGIGPSIENGFYYDFDLGEEKIGEPDLAKIEAKMREIRDRGEAFVKKDISIEEAWALFASEPYKLELLGEIEKGERGGDQQSASVYQTGGFVDLCLGPHVRSVSDIGPFKLLSLAGAYWKGREKNQMLTRIYGTAFSSQEDLEEHLKHREEAKKRDHKKLGAELELFMFHDTAPGMPYWLPKGLVVLNELVNFWREEHSKRGYQEIKSPLINKRELYITSGHWEHYLENMFVSETKENEVYALKPMNCPNAMVVFGSKTRSYRDLPLRLSDTDTLHRFELSGTLSGLLRVREFSQDDAHIFVAQKQITEEYQRILEITELFYSIFGIEYSFRLGTRPKEFMGDQALWDIAETQLKQILEESKKPYFVFEGDGVFYGPKLDILMKDALGRQWQMGTIQLDFQIPLRFNLKYTAEDGSQKTPAVIHRVIYGSLERFIGILIEHFAGAFPVWLSPEQAVVIPISERHLEYAKSVAEDLSAAGHTLRIALDDRNETLQARIRDAQIKKVPYMLIVGDKEAQNGTVSVRLRTGEDLGQKPIDEFKNKVKEVVLTKSLELW